MQADRPLGFTTLKVMRILLIGLIKQNIILHFNLLRVIMYNI